MKNEKLITERAEIKKRILDFTHELTEKTKILEQTKADLQAAVELVARLKESLPILKTELKDIQSDIDDSMDDFASLTFKIEGLATE